MLAKNYIHPHYGTFYYNEDDEAWVPSEELLFFSEFELFFHTDNETIIPNEISEILLTNIMKNYSNIIDSVMQSLWNNLNHMGKKSGMWWENESLEDIFENDNIPNDYRELKKYVNLYAIEISDGLAEFRFHATFEEEHGVGILYNGDSILGIGYTYSVTPYKENTL